MITMEEWLAYAYDLSNEEITALITEFSKIQTKREGEKRRAAAKKVIEAITEYLEFGKEISICGRVYNEDRVYEEVDATFDGYINSDGYLTFNFIQ